MLRYDNQLTKLIDTQWKYVTPVIPAGGARMLVRLVNACNDNDSTATAEIAIDTGGGQFIETTSLHKFRKSISIPSGETGVFGQFQEVIPLRAPQRLVMRLTSGLTGEAVDITVGYAIE